MSNVSVSTPQFFPTPPPARFYRHSRVIHLPPDTSGERSVALARSRASGITWEVTFRSVLSYVTLGWLCAPSTALFRRSFHTRRSTPLPCVPSSLPSTRSSRRRAVCARDGSRHSHQRPSRTSFRHVLSYVPLSGPPREPHGHLPTKRRPAALVVRMRRRRDADGSVEGDAQPRWNELQVARANQQASGMWERNEERRRRRCTPFEIDVDESR